MNKLVFPLAIGLALSFSGAALAGPGVGCGGSLKSAKAPQQTVMQTPAPEKPVVPVPVKKPTKG
jgi:hypothetical protein